MKYILSSSIYALVVLLLFGCSGMNTLSSDQTNVYTRDLGKGTQQGIEEYTRKILNEYQYVIEEYDNSPERMYFETIWKNRTPLEDEKSLGASQARTKIWITTRPRTRFGGGSAVLSTVDFRAENELLIDNNWEATPLSDDFNDYIKKISGDLKMELDQMVREF